MDDIGVRRSRDGVVVEEVRWDELRRVEIVTTSDGPAMDDVFWLLEGTGNAGVVVPSEQVPQGMTERLQELPGFDNGEVIRAMSSTTDARFLCWDATGDANPDLRSSATPLPRTARKRRSARAASACLASGQGPAA